MQIRNLECFLVLINGVGRFFEGTAADMHKSLKKITRLPRNTKVWVSIAKIIAKE